MVKNTSALGFNKGIYDWLLLRAAAIVMTLYILYIIGFILTVDPFNYMTWRNFFTYYLTKCFTLITLVSMVIHSWIGIWQVLTDYVKCFKTRIMLQLVHFIILCGYISYGIIVVWSV
ncbi:MAG: succinate dehydrogenase, hydrophobic membrane anchor protein [Candidatus Dasytiphilus stammeri]